MTFADNGAEIEDADIQAFKSNKAIDGNPVDIVPKSVSSELIPNEKYVWKKHQLLLRAMMIRMIRMKTPTYPEA